VTRILLVEDSDEHADICTRVLTAKKGWTVTRALSVKEAMLHVALKPFDIALVDYKLPDGDGIDLLDSIRAQKPGLPVLFLTAYGSEEVAMTAMTRGAVDYVVKAVNYQKTLPQRVAAALERGEDIARMGAAIRHSPEAASPNGPVVRPPNHFDGQRLQRVCKEAVHGDVLGCAVLDAQGRALAAKLAPGIDAGGLGAALVSMQVQAHLALRQMGQQGAARAMLVDYDGGLLAIAALPGPALVVLMMKAGADHEGAAKRAKDVAQQAWESSKA
jgi:DNA-binding response OmpR family regulator